jgi:glucose-1-phosphate adenylyltransferase
MSPLLDSYVASVPAQQRLGKRWFSGSADAILQSLNLINDEKPDIVVVIGADHVYRMDFRQMLESHIATGARATVAGIRQPLSLANQFGVIDVEDKDPAKIREFLEKPQDAKGLIDAPHEVLASMGNYIFDTDALIEAVESDGELPTSNHDMGGDIIPYFVGRGEAGVYDMKLNDVPGSTDRDRDYWRDVGTIDSFFDAHMDLISTLPIFNLYNMQWPIHSQTVNSPPAKFVRDSVGRIGNAIDSIVSLGSVLSGTHLERSVVGPWTLAGGGSTITDSVLFDHVRVGQGARIHRAILDKNVVLADGATVGVDRERDIERGYTVTETGLTVVGKGVHVDA